MQICLGVLTHLAIAKLFSRSGGVTFAELDLALRTVGSGASGRRVTTTTNGSDGSETCQTSSNQSCTQQTALQLWGNVGVDVQVLWHVADNSADRLVHLRLNVWRNWHECQQA